MEGVRITLECLSVWLSKSIFRLAQLPELSTWGSSYPRFWGSYPQCYVE